MILKRTLSLLLNSFRIRNKALRVANYVTASIFLVYFFLLVYPNVLFGHTVRYKSFIIHSRAPVSEAIKPVLDEAERKLLSSPVWQKGGEHNLYICNSAGWFSFFAPLSRKAFACNYPILNNIFIASCNADINQAFKFDDNDKYTRQLSALIAHEVNHSYLEKKTGFLKFKMIDSWKNEGLSEFVAYGPDENIDGARKFLARTKHDQGPGALYRKYYLAVNYLIVNRKLTVDSLISSKLSLDEVLNEIESAE